MLFQMTKSYARNNIILAGQGHINVYATFLIKNGFKTEWTSEQKSLKCSKIFEYEEGFLSQTLRKTLQYFTICLVPIKHAHLKNQLSLILNIYQKKNQALKHKLEYIFLFLLIA